MKSKHSLSLGSCYQLYWVWYGLQFHHFYRRHQSIQNQNKTVFLLFVLEISFISYLDLNHYEQSGVNNKVLQIGQATLFHCSALLSATSFRPIHQTTDAQWSHPAWKPWSKYPSLPFWVIEENVPAERSRIWIKTENIEHMLKVNLCPVSTMSTRKKLLEGIFLPLCGNSKS